MREAAIISPGVEEGGGALSGVSSLVAEGGGTKGSRALHDAPDKTMVAMVSAIHQIRFGFIASSRSDGGIVASNQTENAVGMIDIVRSPIQFNHHDGRAMISPISS